MKEGYIQVFTGEGKGKTTAALGLSLRAAGAGLKVFFGQFMKKGVYSELKALERFSDLITVKQFGRKGFVLGNPAPEDIQAARSGLKKVKQLMAEEKYDIIILDEANVSVTLKLLTEQDLLDLIADKPPGVELVLTGRYAPAGVMDAADLVTEMVPRKHYFDQGVMARVGIEK